MSTMASAAFQPLPLLRPRAMTRCECAGCAFSEVARLMRSEGVGVEEACRRTGCGQTCGACVPDLHGFLRAQGLQP
jgi:NAD(P)H-nitrite reductase large subunit